MTRSDLSAVTSVGCNLSSVGPHATRVRDWCLGHVAGKINARKENVSRRPGVTPKHTGIQTEICFIPALSRLPAVKQQQDPISSNLWSCVCTRIPRITSQNSGTDWALQLLFVICFQRTLQDPDGVFCSSSLLGRPKVFYFWTLWHRGVRNYFRFPPFPRRSTPPAWPGIAFVAWQQ